MLGKSIFTPEKVEKTERAKPPFVQIFHLRGLGVLVVGCIFFFFLKGNKAGGGSKNADLN